MNFPTIKSRNTAKRVARFGWPTPIVWSRCHREPAMQPFRRSAAAPYASPLFCRSAGWGLFFECQRKQTPWNGVTLPFFVPRPAATRNREKTYTVFAIAHAGALDLIRTAMEAYVIGLPAWPPPLQFWKKLFYNKKCLFCTQKATQKYFCHKI